MSLGLWRVALVAIPQLIALLVLLLTEVDTISRIAFLLSWMAINLLLIAITRRPAISGALALGMLTILILLSRLKYDVLQMTVNFIDVMMIDRASAAYLFTIFPKLWQPVSLVLLIAVPLGYVLWRFDPFRVCRLRAAAASAAAMTGLVALSLIWPHDPWEGWFNNGYLSKFARSGVNSVADFMQYGFLESDPIAADRLVIPREEACNPAGRRPHIVMIHDESSFDIRSAPDIKVPANYGDHFRSFDGKSRKFLVEGNGGPSWFTEYNVLAGLSSRSYGRFSYFVTRIASGRVERGLPMALRRCGYQTVSLYPAAGAFMGAHNFQTTTGMERFLDARMMGAKGIEPDSFYYGHALNELAAEKDRAPVFMFVYLAANHFPWASRFRPDLTPGWRDPGNKAHIDEYIRRQTMSAVDYRNFVEQLKKQFPGEPFLIVRFGDHQPDFSTYILDPGLDDAEIAKRLMDYDPRYYTTYYAIDTINFKPVRLSSALPTVDAPYLPIVIQDAAGIPLDPTFVEQKKIMLRCNGLFYACRDGAEARRLNRMLIEAGFIKDL
jgi:Sulfatase